MSEWQLHTPNDDNVFFEYRCGVVAGQRITLRKDLVIRDHRGLPTGKVHPQGEVWKVLPGLRSDPVLWLLQPDGNRCTWDDDPIEVSKWFQSADPNAD